MIRPSPRVTVEGISAGFSDTEVLSNLWLTAEVGEVITIHGENGSGKSTLARVLAGLHKPRMGRILIDGQDITKLPPWRRRSIGLCFVPQCDRVFRDLTVRDNARLLGRRAPGRSLPQSVSSHLGDAAWLQEAWEMPAGNLSGGRQALLALAATVSAMPCILLLDEPAAELDDTMVQVAARIVRDACRSGTTALIFEHRRAFARIVANRELRLADGHL